MNPLDGLQSALNPRSPEAAAIADVATLLFAGGAAIFVAVMALAALALWRRPRWLARTHAVVVGGIVFPVVVLAGLLVHSLVRAPAWLDGEPDLRVAVTGRQWWWEIRYLTPDGRTDAVTANELRLPVGRRVEVVLASADVLHSFWVPSLAGKLDLIPGRLNRLRFTPAEAGTWRGQCAEYCGGPHAKMAFHVVALAQPAFDAWLARQKEPARAPLPPAFAEHCAACHTVRGTAAAGTLGPDLTHVAGRVALGAGVLPAGRASLAAWIAGSQQLKPGNLMPSFTSLSGAQVDELADALARLD